MPVLVKHEGGGPGGGRHLDFRRHALRYPSLLLLAPFWLAGVVAFADLSPVGLLVRLAGATVVVVLVVRSFAIEVDRLGRWRERRFWAGEGGSAIVRTLRHRSSPLPPDLLAEVHARLARATGTPGPADRMEETAYHDHVYALWELHLHDHFVAHPDDELDQRLVRYLVWRNYYGLVEVGRTTGLLLAGTLAIGACWAALPAVQWVAAALCLAAAVAWPLAVRRDQVIALGDEHAAFLCRRYVENRRSDGQQAEPVTDADDAGAGPDGPGGTIPAPPIRL